MTIPYIYLHLIYLLHRHFPSWQSMNTRRPLLPPQDNVMSPRETLNYFLERFCSNLNCVTSFCTTHCGFFLYLLAPFLCIYSFQCRHERRARWRPKSIPQSLGKPCKIPVGETVSCTPPLATHPSYVRCQCTIPHSPTFHVQGTLWTPTDIEMLHVTLDYAPDTLPCDLAVIVRKPCREVRPTASLRRAPYYMLLIPRGVRTMPCPGLPPAQDLRIPRAAPARAHGARHAHGPHVRHARRAGPQDGDVRCFPSPCPPFH